MVWTKRRAKDRAMSKAVPITVITVLSGLGNRPMGKGTGRERGRASRRENSLSENVSASVCSCAKENAGESLLDRFNDVDRFWTTSKGCQSLLTNSNLLSGDGRQLSVIFDRQLSTRSISRAGHFWDGLLVGEIPAMGRRG